MLGKKIRSLAGSKHVLILTHDNPDPDAIASSWGLAYLIKKELDISSTIAFGGFIGRAENRAMVNVLRIPIVGFSPLLLEKHYPIVMLDCQPYTGNCSLPDECVPEIVIDHHPLRETTKFKQWAYVNEKMGAISTIIAFSLKERNVAIPKRLATALFYAIRSETKDLGRKGTRLDYKHYLFLLPKVNFKALYRIVHPPLSSDYYRSVKDALERSRVYRFVVVCSLGAIPYPELPAEIADFLIFKENISCALVMGWYKKDIFLSIRSMHPDTNSADIMQTILKGYGRGGGHEIMAGGKIPDVPISRVRDTEQAVTKRFLRFFSLSGVKEEKLI